MPISRPVTLLSQAWRQRRSLAGLGELRHLKHLQMPECSALTHIPDIGQLGKLENLDLQGCEALQRLPDLSQLTRCGT